MAWTTPKTWTDGSVVTASELNTHIRDQLLALSTHKHTGAAGDGDDILQSINNLIFDHISTPSAPGAGKSVIYSKSDGLYIRIGAGAETQISDENHSHTPTEQSTDFDEGFGLQPWTTNDLFRSGETTPSQDAAVTFSKTGLIVVAYSGIISQDRDWEMDIEGTVKASATNVQRFSGIYSESKNAGTYNCTITCTDAITADDHFMFIAALAAEV